MLLSFCLCLQSCVEEIPSPHGSFVSTGPSTIFVTGGTEICSGWSVGPTYLIYDNVENVDSFQWNPSINLNFELLGDTLVAQSVDISGDTAFVSVLEFNSGDTSMISITILDCFQTVYIPTGFTPNGDNINEYWHPVFSNVQELNWTIRSDDGNLIFDNENDLSARWNGTWNGTPAPTGLYWYDVRWFSLSDSLYQDRSGWLQLYRD